MTIGATSPAVVLTGTSCVDVVQPGTASPDPHRASRIVEGMRDRGVLIGGSEPRKDGMALGY